MTGRDDTHVLDDAPQELMAGLLRTTDKPIAVIARDVGCRIDSVIGAAVYHDFSEDGAPPGCASLMLAAGRPIAEVAEHLGHGVDVCARTYAHSIESLKGKPPMPVDEAIRTARSEVFRGDDVR